jgi:hypothetical protein
MDEFSQYHLLIFSSLIFLTNFIFAYFTQRYIYSLLFFLLTITSVFFHSTYDFYIMLFDKIAILSIVSYGSYMLWNSKYEYIHNKIIFCGIVFTFLLTLYLYIYGYFTQQYCFDNQFGNYYHALIHLISSFGHHMILFLHLSSFGAT